MIESNEQKKKKKKKKKKLKIEKECALSSDSFRQIKFHGGIA